MQSDIADGSLRDWEVRKFDFLVGDYYIAPSFLDAVVVSLACKCFDQCPGPLVGSGLCRSIWVWSAGRTQPCCSGKSLLTLATPVLASSLTVVSSIVPLPYEAGCVSTCYRTGACQPGAAHADLALTWPSP